MPRRDLPIKILDKENGEDLRYWLSRTPDERVSAVEFLRQQCDALSGLKETPRLVKKIRLVSRGR